MVKFSRLSTSHWFHAQTMIFMYEYGSSFLKSLLTTKVCGIVSRTWAQFSYHRIVLILFVAMLLIRESLQDEELTCSLQSSTPWISGDGDLKSFFNGSYPRIWGKGICPKEMSNTTGAVRDTGSSLVSVCNASVESRTQLARDRSLPFCDSYSLFDVLEEDPCLLGSYSDCVNCTSRVQCMDALAQNFSAPFQSVMDRFDCVRSNFSVNWGCSNCMTAYKNWVCAMTIKVRRNATVLRPCMEFCKQVEQQCPYFLPDKNVQYGGHPSFICEDYSISSLEQPVFNSSPIYGLKGDCHRIGLTTTSSASPHFPSLWLVMIITLVQWYYSCAT